MQMLSQSCCLPKVSAGQQSRRQQWQQSPTTQHTAHLDVLRCNAAATERGPFSCSSPASSRPGTSSNSAVGSSSTAAPAAPVPTNHNNAVPMPRNAAAAATAVAVAAPAAQQAAAYVHAVSDADQLPGPVLRGPPQHTSDRADSSHLYPKGAAGRAAPTAPAPAAAVRMACRLTRDIMACSSTQQLQQLYHQHAAQLNLIHISAVFKKLTHLMGQQQQSQEPQQRHHQHLQQDGAQQQPQSGWGRGSQQQQQPRQQWDSWGVPSILLEHWGQQNQHHSCQAGSSFIQQLELHSLQLLSSVQLPQPGAMQLLQAAGGGRLPHLPAQMQQPAALLLRQGLSAPTSSHADDWCWDVSGSSSGQACGQAIQPQQLSTLCWSFASLGHQPSAAWWACYWAASTPLLHSYQPRELATAISAAGKLQQVPPAGWMAAFEAACVAGGLAGATPQELCMILQGVVVLKLQPGVQWVAAVQDTVLQQLDKLGARDISQVLWGHARLAAAPPKPWLSAVLAAASAQLARFSVRDTAMLLWALAALGVCPDAQLLSTLLGGMTFSSYKQRAASPQDFAHISWAVATFARLAGTARSTPASSSSSNSSSIAEGSRRQLWPQQQQQQQQGSVRIPLHPAGLSQSQLQDWFSLTWQMTQPDGSTSVSSGHSWLTETAPSAAVHSQHKWPRQRHQQQQQRQQQPQQRLTLIDAAQLLWSASQFDSACWPDRAWLGHFWSQMQLDLAHPAHLAHGSAQSLTVTLWAGLRMRQPPPRAVLMAAVPVLQRQLAELQPAAACQLLCVLAKLQHRPNPAFMEQLLSRLQLDSHQLEPRAFACVLWALGRLGYQPGATWWATVLTHLQGLVGQLGQRELANVLSGLVALGVWDSSSSSSSGGSGGEDGGSGVCLSPQLRQALLLRAQQLGVACCPLED